MGEHRGVGRLAAGGGGVEAVKGAGDISETTLESILNEVEGWSSHLEIIIGRPTLVDGFHFVHQQQQGLDGAGVPSRAW